MLEVRQDTQMISVTFAAGENFAGYLLQRKFNQNIIDYEHMLFSDYCTRANRQNNYARHAN